MERTRRATRDRTADAALAADFGATLLRVTIAMILIVKGWEKATGFDAWVVDVTELGIPFPEIMAPIAVGAELGGAILLLLGLFTRLGALAILGLMTAAIAHVHLEHGLRASEGGFEYPLTLGMVALFFLLRGAGSFSLDRLLFGAEVPERGGPPTGEGEKMDRVVRPEHHTLPERTG